MSEKWVQKLLHILSMTIVFIWNSFHHPSPPNHPLHTSTFPLVSPERMVNINFCNTTAGFLARWCLRNELKNFYSVNVSLRIQVVLLIGWTKFSAAQNSLPRSEVLCHQCVSQTSNFMRKPGIPSQNFGCFLRLLCRQDILLHQYQFIASFTAHIRVLKSSRLPAKIATYLVSIDQLLCLTFLYRWRFLNKISLDWLHTLATQPSTSKLSDNPDI